MNVKSQNRFYLLLISLTSAMGGLLFGYDWVVIGGAKPFYELYFNISNSPSIQGFVMGSAIIGCLVGVITSGSLSDRYGRKLLLVAAALIFVVAAVGTGICDTLEWFIFYRILGGVGIGIASNISPMYIAEVAPSHMRGRYVSLYQLTIVIGILSAQLINWLIAEPVSGGEDILLSWNGQMGWRWMFWAGGVPAVLFVFLIFFIPESPRWLSAKLRFDQSKLVLQKIGGEQYATNEMMALKNISNIAEKANDKMLFSGKMPKILLIGIVIAVFQQWCGINVIFNYAQDVFSAAGYGVSDILFNIVITGVTNMVFTFVGMYMVDRFGRRALMMLGAVGLAVIYSLLGACYFMGFSGIPVLVLVMLAIGCYAMSLAPITWVVLSEIFPTKIRGMAMGVATFMLWSACFVLTYTFPLLNSSLGAYGTFWLYGLICLLGFFFIMKYLPETKGKSLEEIEKELTV